MQVQVLHHSRKTNENKYIIQNGKITQTNSFNKMIGFSVVIVNINMRVKFVRHLKCTIVLAQINRIIMFNYFVLGYC